MSPSFYRCLVTWQLVKISTFEGTIVKAFKTWRMVKYVGTSLEQEGGLDKRWFPTNNLKSFPFFDDFQILLSLCLTTMHA